MEKGNLKESPRVSRSENERTIKLLFEHFCNNLYLGQWQLACSSVKHLFDHYRDPSICDILKDIIAHPFNRSIQSPAVPSPYQLSWLCLQEYEKLVQHGPQPQTEGEVDGDLLEFQLLLIEVCPHITDQLLKELYLYYRWKLSSSSSKSSLNFSPSLLKFVQTLLSRKPELGHALTLYLLDPKNPKSSKNNRGLHLSYINSINSLLDELLVEDLDSDVKKSTASKIYLIFSYFDPGEYASKLPLRQLMSKLIEYCTHEHTFLSKTRILSALIGRSDNHILKEFCNADYEAETNNAVATYQTCAELTEEQRWVLHLSTLTDTDTRWKMFFLFCMKKRKHLLEVILETGLSLIKCSMFEELGRLMEPAELHPLKPLLLLLGWSHCYSSNEARRLLQMLWSEKPICHHPAIAMGCNKLAYQIDLIQWCLEKTKPLQKEEVTVGPQFQRAADLFKGLESHSVLYVLHNSTRLSSLDQQEVLELLQKVPLQGDKDASPEMKRQKTVRFHEETRKQPVAATASLEQLKDMAIYTGYCIMKNIMDAILFCSESSDRRLNKPVKSSSRRKISNRLESCQSSDSEPRSRGDSLLSYCDTFEPEEQGDTDVTQKKIPKVDVKLIYKENVTLRFAQAKSYLAQLQPLTFRVELLENIFSLLFLTHEDVQEDLVFSEYSSDTDDKSCRSASTGVQTPLNSPLKESSSSSRIPEVFIEKTAESPGTKYAYDVPFEAVKPSVEKRKSDAENVKLVLENVKSKIMEKIENKGAKEHGRHSSMSENISSLSNCSSINLNCFGFVNNEYLVRDILALLKDSILDVSAAKFQIHGNKSDARERYKLQRDSMNVSIDNVDPSIEEPLCRLVKSSVTMETLQKRITQLERYISEAQWRYQLVANEHIPKVPGEVLQEIVDKTSDSSDEEVEIKGINSSQKSRKRRLSGRRSPRHINGEGENQSDFDNLGAPLQRSSSCVVARKPAGHLRSQSLVSMMLASPGTLLIMSIRKGHFNQTKQIIKLSKLEQTPEAVEVFFSQAFNKASRDIQGIAGNIPASVDKKGGKLGMKSIASVAAAGVATASLSEIVNELLTFPTIPCMPKLGESENLPQNVIRIFQADNIAAMILLDLICSSAKSWDVCNHLMDSVKMRTPVKSSTKTEVSKQTLDTKSPPSSGKQRMQKIKSFTDVLTQLDSMFDLGKDEHFSHQDPITIQAFQKSAQYYLTQGVLPLNSESCKSYSKFCLHMTKLISRAENALHSHPPESPQRAEFRQRLCSSDSLKSEQRSEKPVIHHYMKRLIKTMQTDVPAGGVIAFTGRQLKTVKGGNRQYLLCLYEHCKELACLMAESEAHNKETMVKPKNYFEVLEEGPLRILGRMMFTKKMPPEKLEKVAEKLSLNLTHIIVYSCCVRVPSKRLPLLDVASTKQEWQLHDGKQVYNCGEVPEVTDTPEVFLRNLLAQLLQLMKEIASECNAAGLFDHTCADRLTNTTQFYNILSQTAVLQTADVASLSKTDRKCFYGNLLTLMSIHCFVSHIQKLRAEGGVVVEKNYSQMSSTQQISLLSLFSYRVGQLGVVSLFDLKYQILRYGLLPPSEWGVALRHRLRPLDETDPWYHLAPSPDSLLLFTVTACSVSSPPIQILKPDTVHEQLTASLHQYLHHTVQVDTAARLVKIPELLLWYRQDFISEQLIPDHSENDGLIAFIATQSGKEREEKLMQLINLDKKQGGSQDRSKSSYDIEVIPCVKDFLCMFDFESMSQTGEHVSSERKPLNLISSVTDSNISDLDITYNLTPNTLEYVKSDCPLVATLVSLMCSDDIDNENLEDFINESYFNISGSTESFDTSRSDIMNRSRAASSMSLVDIRSYRYEKLTNEYPTLKRHLLNYIVPLAATEDPDIFKGDDPILKLMTSEIIERFKANMLTLHESNQFRTLLTGLLNELFQHSKWTEILRILDCIPVSILRKTISLCNLHDFVVCCSIHTLCGPADKKENLSVQKSEKVKTLLHRMLSAEMQAREVTTVCGQLQIDHNIDLLEMCLCKRSVSDRLKSSLEQKLRLIKTYHRVTECAKNLQIKLSMQSTELITEEDKMAAKKKHLILDRFTDWHNVVEWTKTSPREILALLIKAGDFETARRWCQLNNLDHQIRTDIEENHLISLLSAEPPNTTKAFMILEGLRQEGGDVCLSMCNRCVEVFNKQQDVMFMSSYILNQLASDLSPSRVNQLRLIHIGARMILCLPESMHHEYSHLVTRPSLILEQLLMNMKLELAGKAFETVKAEFCIISEPALRFTTEQFNTMVALYAKKSLEFTVIQYMELDKERSMSVRSSSSDKFDQDSPVMQNSPQSRHEFLTNKRRSFDLHGSRLAVSAPVGGGSPGGRAFQQSKAREFVMPAEPPPRDQWVADSATSVCMVCKVERFSMFNRRHHCRRCGRVVCARCSQNVTPVKGVSARTCDDCYSQMVRTSDLPVSHNEMPTSSQSQTASPHSALQDSVLSRIDEVQSMSLSDVVCAIHTRWKLQTDEVINESLREDFYFEQAPSTSLCISLLNLHGNIRECGQLILGMCDTLSQFLKPLAPGVPNPEVDYNLIISMLKYLLFHAKMKFTKCGSNSGIGRCDLYQGLVDLLNQLVVSNYRDLPSIQELTKVDSVRRLRDKLIEDERLPLAMEVSTKCGLDPSGVWAAWGLVCLQSGDFTGAREKFAKCLKPLKDKNQSVPNTKVLNDIIDCLETMPGTGSMEIQILLSQPGSMKGLINTPSSTFFEEASMDSQQFQECVYYLRTYSSYLSLVDFHRRHGYYMKAVQYILDHKCSTEVYVEGLLRPCLETGEIGRLLDQMLMIDPSLEKWNTYLTAACRYFLKLKLHHVLYDFQLFMKDYIRAGMSCYSYFYQDGAQTYLDLSRKIQHLFKAQQHMQAYLDPGQWGNVQHPLTMTQDLGSRSGRGTKGEPVSVRLVMQPDEVNKMIRTIGLQIEVTKYLEACLTADSSRSAMLDTSPTRIPTLFSNNQARNQLAIMILLCGSNLEQSMSLVSRIIKEYKLGPVGIYTHTAREFAKARRYSEMRSLVTLVEKSGHSEDNVIDDILGACLLVVADNKSEAKEADNIIKLLRKDSNKINAYILCGKLRSAYLMAVKDTKTDERLSNVRRILRAAKSMDQPNIVSICNKWLDQNQANN